MAYHRQTLEILENNVGVSDLVLLEPLTTDELIANLKRRFKHDMIYTYIGGVVVSVNPYRQLRLYTPELISEYRFRNIYEMPPHLYAIADEAYRSMRDRNLDQVVIISGESGAGKTEASKVILQYVAAVSSKGVEIDRVKEQLLQSNPVLEAFGNAKTKRNDNSSRFGKYMDIEFDFRGNPIGGVITNYLLEKSRVAFQMPGERNFHVFYQLLAGADDRLLDALLLRKDIENYSYLRNGHVEITRDDSDDFQETLHAMMVLGFRDLEIHSCLKLVAGVLKLGNVEFVHKNMMNNTDGCLITDFEELDDVADLLKCDPDLLVKALTQRTIEVKASKVKTSLSVHDAYYARDALCKALYSRMFSWLVSRINDSISVKAAVRRKVIGVLDIYGFEIFENNSFEQFVINYCNEKLQQVFVERTLKEEQDEYIAEGIEWIHVEYFNNAVICKLIEQPLVGLLAILDEECMLPGKKTDDSFLQKMDGVAGSSPHYMSRGCKKSRSDKTLPYDSFRLLHYAGEVTYSVEGFLEKNSDLLYRDLSRAMWQCRHPLLPHLFPEGDPDLMSRRRPPTAGAQFRISISKLMDNLLSKHPHYIRCIKPNDLQQPRIFDENIVRHQVRYLNLMENVRVRRAGYAFRQLYPQFLFRYKMLCQETWPVWGGEPKEGVANILQDLGIAREEYAFGRTKLFVANPRTLFVLEECRRYKLHHLATLIQKVWRGFFCWKSYQMKREAQICISCNYRMYAARKRYLDIKAATLVFQRYCRGWQARVILRRLKEEKRRKNATLVIQSYYRGMQARVELRRLKEAKRRLLAAIVIQSYLRGAKARQLAAGIRLERKRLWAVGVIYKYFRGWEVRREFRKKFRSNAGPKVKAFLKQALKVKFLYKLRDSLPSRSPTDNTWPKCSWLYKDASRQLCVMHHRWRCDRHRGRFDSEARAVMREKVVASDLFSEKDCYPASVGKPFEGDYVNLSANRKWLKFATRSPQPDDSQVLFADIVAKVNRADGKISQQLLVLTPTNVLVGDSKSMSVKYRLPLTSLRRISLSPHADTLLVLHPNPVPQAGRTAFSTMSLQRALSRKNADKTPMKGAFLVSTSHVVELATRVMRAASELRHVPDVEINDSISAELRGVESQITFSQGHAGLEDSLKCVKRGPVLEIQSG